MELMSIAMCSQFPDQFYGRVVGKILLNNTDVCLEQLKRGIAWHDKQYANEQPKQGRETYSLAEQQAKLAHVAILSPPTLNL